jgi:hypothetical protein
MNITKETEGNNNINNINNINKINDTSILETSNEEDENIINTHSNKIKNKIIQSNENTDS